MFLIVLWRRLLHIVEARYTSQQVLRDISWRFADSRGAGYLQQKQLGIATIQTGPGRVAPGNNIRSKRESLEYHRVGGNRV